MHVVHLPNQNCYLFVPIEIEVLMKKKKRKKFFFPPLLIDTLFVKTTIEHVIDVQVNGSSPDS